MKFKKEMKIEQLSRCGSWDRGGLKEIIDHSSRIKTGLKGSKEQNKTMSWQPNLQISQKGHDLAPTFS